MAGEPSAYERGQKQGETDQTLANYAEHFRQINGSQERTAKALAKVVEDLSEIRMALQQLKDQFAAATDAVRVTAEALNNAVQQQRDSDEQKRIIADRRWAPLTRVNVIVGVLVSLAALAAVLITVATAVVK